MAQKLEMGQIENGGKFSACSDIQDEWDEDSEGEEEMEENDQKNVQTDKSINDSNKIADNADKSAEIADKSVLPVNAEKSDNDNETTAAEIEPENGGEISQTTTSDANEAVVDDSNNVAAAVTDESCDVTKTDLSESTATTAQPAENLVDNSCEVNKVEDSIAQVDGLDDLEVDFIKQLSLCIIHFVCPLVL